VLEAWNLIYLCQSKWRAPHTAQHTEGETRVAQREERERDTHTNSIMHKHREASARFVFAMEIEREKETLRRSCCFQSKLSIPPKSGRINRVRQPAWRDGRACCIPRLGTSPLPPWASIFKTRWRGAVHLSQEVATSPRNRRVSGPEGGQRKMERRLQSTHTTPTQTRASPKSLLHQCCYTQVFFCL
jgi:hypothetical protein